MINYNLTRKDLNHPEGDFYRYAQVTEGLYKNYKLTVVDNSREIINNKYTHEYLKFLLHLNENVRYYVDLTSDDFNYISDYWLCKPTKYKMYDYKKEVITDEQAIEILTNVFYNYQPNLHSSSCVGTASKKKEDDPNYYQGTYVLNNEKRYTILKIRTKFGIFRGERRYYPDWENENGLIKIFDINFERYLKSLELYNLRRKINNFTNELLDTEPSIFSEYLKLKEEYESNYK